MEQEYESGATKEDRTSLAMFDLHAGAIVRRSAWSDDQQVVTVITTGKANRRAAGAQRQLFISGMGRSWLQAPAVANGSYQWADPAHSNAMRMKSSGGSGLGDAIPTGGAQLLRYAAPGDSASLAQIGHHFTTKDRRGRTIDMAAKEPKAHIWQTVGVDYSGAVAAKIPAVWVLVGGALHFDDRAQVYTYDCGPADDDQTELLVRGHRFELRSKNTPMRLVGWCTYPGDAKIRKVTRDGRLVIELELTELDEKIDGLFADSIAAGELVPVNTAGRKYAPKIDENSLDALLMDADPEAANRDEHAKNIYRKLFQVSTSHKMGDPYRAKRLRSQHVMLLMLCDGEPSKPNVLPADNPALFELGNLAVRYWEHFVEFQPPRKRTQGGQQ